MSQPGKPKPGGDKAKSVYKVTFPQITTVTQRRLQNTPIEEMTHADKQLLLTKRKGTTQLWITARIKELDGTDGKAIAAPSVPKNMLVKFSEVFQEIEDPKKGQTKDLTQFDYDDVRKIVGWMYATCNSTDGGVASVHILLMDVKKMLKFWEAMATLKIWVGCKQIETEFEAYVARSNKAHFLELWKTGKEVGVVRRKLEEYQHRLIPKLSSDDICWLYEQAQVFSIPGLEECASNALQTIAESGNFGLFEVDCMAFVNADAPFSTIAIQKLAERLWQRGEHTTDTNPSLGIVHHKLATRLESCFAELRQGGSVGWGSAPQGLDWEQPDGEETNWLLGSEKKQDGSSWLSQEEEGKDWFSMEQEELGKEAAKTQTASIQKKPRAKRGKNGPAEKWNIAGSGGGTTTIDLGQFINARPVRPTL